jgi:hypothetical protein
MSARSSIISTGRIFRDFGTQTVSAPTRRWRRSGGKAEPGEYHDLAPFEQARFELVDDPFSRAPVAIVRRIGIFRRFIGIAEDGRVMAQSRILFGFDRLGNFQNIDAQ